MNFSNAQKSMATARPTAVGLAVVLIAFVFAVFTPPASVLFALEPSPEADLGIFGAPGTGASGAVSPAPQTVIPPQQTIPPPPPSTSPPAPATVVLNTNTNTNINTNTKY